MAKAKKSAWKRKTDKRGNISYHHESGEWVVRKTNVSGYIKTMFQGVYIGPERAEEPRLHLCRTLAEAKLTVEEYCERQRDDPKARIIQAYKDGNMLLCLDLLFGRIDDKVAKSEESFEQYVNDRLDNLSISRF